MSDEQGEAPRRDEQIAPTGLPPFIDVARTITATREFAQQYIEAMGITAAMRLCPLCSLFGRKRKYASVGGWLEHLTTSTSVHIGNEIVVNKLARGLLVVPSNWRAVATRFKVPTEKISHMIVPSELMIWIRRDDVEYLQSLRMSRHKGYGTPCAGYPLVFAEGHQDGRSVLEVVRDVPTAYKTFLTRYERSFYYHNEWSEFAFQTHVKEALRAIRPALRVA